MKILNFEVFGLNGQNSVYSLEFNSDINIITGRNGAGKTSTLKLLWLLISGNIRQALIECSFDIVYLSTDLYTLLIVKDEIKEINAFKFKCGDYEVNYSSFESDEDSESNIDMFADDDEFNRRIFGNKKRRSSWFSSSKVISNSERLNNAIGSASSKLLEVGESLYFPTFRRIEGGFSLAAQNLRTSDLEAAMTALSSRFSKGGHLFISSLSMSDVSQFMLKEYSNLNDISLRETNNLSQDVIGMIKSYKHEYESIKSANRLLDDILLKIEEIDNNRKSLMRPMEAMQSVVAKIFKDKQISFGKNLKFGDAAAAISSDQLSAGEKQLLSFICYNAFFNDAVFVIDEPELSLHVDWQRSFFKILTEQNPSNQFIVTTHSPFIYSKYPDKDVPLVSDKGDSEGVRHEW